MAKTVGRPPLYDDPLVMEAKIDQYFDRIEAEGDIPTIAELAYELGFCERGALLYYEKKPEFSRTVKKARLRIEKDRVKRLVKSGSPTAGLIFDLVNNHGYINPQHVKHSGDDQDRTPIRMERVQLVGPKADEHSTD